MHGPKNHYLPLLLALAVSAVELPALADRIAPPKAPPAPAQAVKNRRLPDGFYLVLRKGKDENSVKPIAQGEQLLINDYRYFEPSEREAPEYLAVSKTEFIPITLQTKPGMEQDQKGKPKILLQLSSSQTVPLEKFTRKYLGRTIAIVVGEHVVSAHKIKEPITGGRFQISWCGHNACRILMSELDKSAPTK